MRFGLIMEAETELGTTHARRYHQIAEAVVAAEAAGFDFWGSSEQHGNTPNSTISSPMVFYAYIAALTNHIRLRSQIVLLTHKINHPIRVAEDAATLDILSGGRVDLGVGRGNNARTLDFFDAEATQARAEAIESLEIIGKALSQEEFEHDGELLKVPPMHLTPRPVQDPHPPMFMVATSAESHQLAGELGIGCISFDNWLGMDYLYEPIAAYKRAIAAPATPVGKVATNALCMTILTAYCAPTRAEAVEAGAPTALGYAQRAAMGHAAMAKRSKDYAYMARVAEETQDIIDRQDVDALMARTPGVLLGTPDDFIERIKMLEDAGFDEVTMRVEGMGHENCLKAIDLIGTYVIPEFKRPNAIARTPARRIERARAA